MEEVIGSIPIRSTKSSSNKFRGSPRASINAAFLLFVVR